MLINEKNLKISEHRAQVSHPQHRTNVLHLTEKGTMVFSQDAHYSIEVSALKTEPGEKEGWIDPAIIPAMGSQGYPFELKAVNVAKVPKIDIAEKTAPVALSIVVDPVLLVKLLQAAIEFDGDEAKRVRITATHWRNPVTIEARNFKTGQEWTAKLMNCGEDGKDSKRFSVALHPVVPEPPTPAVVEEDPFEAAMRLAAGL